MSEDVVPLPSRWARLAERLGERLNPLVVKEVRQGLRTRLFWVCFGLMLLACLLVALLAYGDMRGGSYRPKGQTYFFTFFVFLGLVHFFIIPYSAYRSLAREREDETWVLLTLTGLGPRRILRGKVASFLIQAGLYASAAGPFLLFSYYLNGIELPSILVVLGLGALWLVFLTVLGVCAATLAEGRLGRAFMHFVVLGVLAGGVAQGLGGAFALSSGGARMMRDNDFFAVVGVAMWLMVSYGVLLFETAVSRLSLSTEDYTRGPRRALLLQMVLSALVVMGLWWQESQEQELAFAGGILGGLHLTLAGLFVATDVDGQARPLRAKTRAWSLLRPGALRGFRFIVVLLLAWTVFILLLQWDSPGTRTNRETLMLATGAGTAYVLLFLSVALLLGRMPRSDRWASPVSVRLLFVALVGLGCVVPPLVALLLGLESNHGLLNLFNPVVGTVNFAAYDYMAERPQMPVELLLVLSVVTVLAVFATDRVLARRERQAHEA
ncbi:ABC-type transport system involved in multi-copper enzyme maturation, permease component [Stigmatella aurantiaca]|uniref:ABC-type transport system involved in multi-copper enzyme maturation, permease component n=1 Tax=Stigmatella aurantiaca TaxID=41 RepID=A0A1H7X4M2_STIAU|nr:ABC transporter permease [Stigmatella aurantiaca]SEM28633.1 ABC-type transport system involved in multi-copper enzyme maturation, permease component [Stigmatella aurantiaca]